MIPALVRADATVQRKVQDHLSVGASMYRAERYREALVEFEAAFQIAPKPVLLINIGQCHRKLADPHRALEAYEKYLAVVGPDDAQRGPVQLLVEAMRRDIANGASSPEPVLAPRVAPVPTDGTAGGTRLATSPPAKTGWSARRKLALGLGLGAAFLVIGGVTVGLTLGLSAGPPSTGLGNYPVPR